MQNDLAQYERIKESTINQYQKVGKIKCPAFGELVYFHSEGFNHLVYKGKSERTKNDQLTKFKLFPVAKRIIEISTTYQEYHEQLIDIRRKKHKKFVNETVMARYWGLVAILNGTKVKAIIRQVGNGQKHFWSVIPNWNTNKYDNFAVLQKSRGDLVED